MAPKEIKEVGGNNGEAIADELIFETKNFKANGTIEVSVCGDADKIDLEEALEQIGVGKYTYMVLLISCYTLLSIAAEIFGIGLAVISAQCDLELDTHRKGIIAAVPMIGIIVSSHTWGYIADTRGRRYTLIITLAGTWVLGFVSSFVTHWIAFALLKFLSVIFASGGHAVVFAILVEMTPKSRRDRHVMLASTCLMLSQAFVAILGYISIRYDFYVPMGALGFTYRPWRLLCQVFALTNFGAMLMFIFCLYESPKFYISQGKEKEGLEVLKKIYASNTGKKPEDYSVKSITMNEEMNKNKEANLFRSMWNQTAPLFQRKYLKNTIIIMYTSAVVFSTAPPLVLWFPTMAKAFLLASPGEGEDNFCGRVVADLARAENETMNLATCTDHVDDLVLYLMMTFGILIGFMGLIATAMLRWFGKRTVVIILNTIGAIGCFVLNHVYGPASLAIYLSMFSNAIVMGIVPAFAVEVYPTYLRSMAVCLTIMVGRGFSSIVINIMGIQVQNNCNYFFYGYGLFVLSGAVVAFLLPGPQKKELPKGG